MDASEFETRRIALFRKLGVDVVPRRVGGTYLLERPGDVPIVFVHGGMAQAAQWAPLAAQLPAHARLLIPDRPGHGLSDPFDYTGKDYRAEAASWLLGLADGLGLERLTVVANSMGGFFTLSFALAHPDRVERIVFLGAPAGLDRRLPFPMTLLWLPPVRHWVTHHDSTVEAGRKFMGTILVAHAERVDADLIVLENANSQLGTNGDSMSTMLAQVVQFPGVFAKRWMLRDECAALDVPVHFVWGDRDAFAPPSSGHDLVRRMPRATIEVVPDAGHLPWVDEPERCAREVERALGLVA